MYVAGVVWLLTCASERRRLCHCVIQSQVISHMVFGAINQATTQITRTLVPFCLALWFLAMVIWSRPHFFPAPQAMLDKASSQALPTEEVVRLPLTRVRRGAAAAAAVAAAAAGMSAIKE